MARQQQAAAWQRSSTFLGTLGQGNTTCLGVGGCSLLSPISFLGVSAIICNKREMRANDPCSAPVIHHTLPLYTLHEIGEYQTTQNMNYCIHFTFTYFSKYFTKHLYLDNCNLFTICKRDMQEHSCGTGTGSVYHDWNQML